MKIMNKLNFNHFIIGLSKSELCELLQISQNGVNGVNGGYYEALELEILEYILNIEGAKDE